jgi:hypothetical protein
VLTPTDLQLDLSVLGSNPSLLSGIFCFSYGTSECDSLSLNQKELAETIENLSKSNKVQKHTDLYTALRILKYLEPDEKKEALEDTRGYFISNAIIRQGMDRTTKGVYEHIDINWNKKCTKIEDQKNEPFNNDKSYKYELLVEHTNSRKDKWSKGIWGEVQGQLIRMEEQENSPKKFEVNGGGVIVGFDVMAREDIKVGIFGQFNRNWIKQDKNKGEINNNGLGIYAGINKWRFDLKTMVLGSISEYEMTRVIRLGFPDEAKGKTNGVNGNLDMEIGYKVPIYRDIQNREENKLTLRPYTGVTATIVNTKGYKEVGMYPMRLDVKENNYFKSSLRAGVGLTGERRSFNWNISAGVGYVAAGRKAKVSPNDFFCFFGFLETIIGCLYLLTDFSSFCHSFGLNGLFFRKVGLFGAISRSGDDIMVNIPPIKSLNHDASTSLGKMELVINTTLKPTTKLFFIRFINGFLFAFIFSVSQPSQPKFL